MKKLLIAALLLTLAAPAANAKSKIMKNFKAAYPTSKLDGCVICHVSEDDETFNAYGQTLADAGQNFKAIEAVDSDGDGKTNIEEINAGTNPGDMSSVPLVQGGN